MATQQLPDQLPAMPQMMPEMGQAGPQPTENPLMQLFAPLLMQYMMGGMGMQPQQSPQQQLMLALVNAMDPESQKMIDLLGQDPKYAPILKAAQAHPRTVEVSQPGPRGNPQAQALPPGLQGRWEMYPGGNDTIRTAPGAGKDTMAHELTHFLLGNNPVSQGMPQGRQESISQTMGDYGARTPQVYPDLAEIYRLLIGR